jgi:hypothetical protein
MSEKDQQLPFDREHLDRERARAQRLNEILEQESLLKRERQRLSVEKPWYKKPEIVVTIIGIIVPLIASYLISATSSDKKELTITYSALYQIITESDKFQGNLVINYDSAQVSNISKLTLKIKNTGDVSLIRSDFADGPLNFHIKYNGNTNSSILQVNKLDDASQQNSELTSQNYKSLSEIKYLPSLLNKGDEVTIETYFLNSPTTSISLTGKLLNGNIIGPKPYETTDSKLGYKSYILSFNSFFSYKWLTIFILILFFILPSLSAMVQFSMISDGEVEPPVLFFAMGLASALVAVFALVMIVSTLIYV